MIFRLLGFSLNNDDFVNFFIKKIYLLALLGASICWFICLSVGLSEFLQGVITIYFCPLNIDHTVYLTIINFILISSLGLSVALASTCTNQHYIMPVCIFSHLVSHPAPSISFFCNIAHNWVEN